MLERLEQRAAEVWTRIWERKVSSRVYPSLESKREFESLSESLSRELFGPAPDYRLDAYAPKLGD